MVEFGKVFGRFVETFFLQNYLSTNFYRLRFFAFHLFTGPSVTFIARIKMIFLVVKPLLMCFSYRIQSKCKKLVIKKAVCLFFS